MTTVIEPSTLALKEAHDDDIDHVYCCDPNTSICGKDISDLDEECDPDCWTHPTCSVCWINRHSILWTCPLCDKQGWE